ncbi:MAG: hypothetical protein Q7N87_00250 [Candidatus Uhrbacteria bacterium]|nr:hypothetical protein [Candidatus Uhrbacteria bacterium]
MIPNVMHEILKVLVLLGGFMNASVLSLQGFKLLKTRSVKGVSLSMYYCFIVLQMIFATHNFLKGDWYQFAGLVANMTVTLWVIILAMYYKYQVVRT